MINKRFLSFSRAFVLGNILTAIAISPAIAESELFKTLIVTGNGIEQISTTIAEVQLGVEIQGKTAAQVQQDIAKRTSAIIDLLRSQDVEELQTTGVRLNPNYGDRNNSINGTEIIGYSGTNIVSFQIPIEQVGTLLDKAVRSGASRVDGISFTATPEAIAIAKKEALRKATLDARDKAEVVLDTLELTSQEIVNIEVDEANIVRPRSISKGQFALSESRASTPIVGGEQTVRGSITLQISY